MFEWYIPWDQVDWGLKLQLIIWCAAILSSYWICWRTLIRKRTWLRPRDHTSRRSEPGSGKDK